MVRSQRMKTLPAVFLLVGSAALFAACSVKPATQSVKLEDVSIESVQEDQFAATNSAVETGEAMEITELKVGTGAEAQSGKKVKVHYTGTFLDGKVFDSSVTRGEPFSFTLGAGQVIEGWDQGVAGMKVGGKRKLVIPPELAYGPNGIPGAIPPNATLAFEVELLGVE